MKICLLCSPGKLCIVEQFLERSDELASMIDNLVVDQTSKYFEYVSKIGQ